MLIGLFHRSDDGFFGRLRTMTLDISLRIRPAAPPIPDKGPDWRIYLDVAGHGAMNHSVEVGSGWTHEREGGGSTIAIQLDCPAMAQPLRATLVPPRDASCVHALLWSRPRSE